MGLDLFKKSKKEETEVKDEEDEEESSSSSYNPRGGMLKFLFIILAIIAIIFIVLYALSSCSPKSYTYQDVENEMREAAQTYFKEHPESLPAEEGSIVEISATDLYNLGLMKELSHYTGEVACAGTVQVQKAGSEYLYTPYLNCGDTYATTELVNAILANEPVVSSGYGLYSSSGGYTFRGETVNNYVQLDNSLWRIVKITSNDNLVLVSSEGLHYTQPWDNRYNEENLYEAGLNQYRASRVKEYLERIYSNPSEKDEEVILSDKDKARMIPFNVCTGKRNADSTRKDNSEECSEVLKDQNMGLLTLSDYLYASIDPNCKSASTKTCKNYNYLVMKEDWWLVTASKKETSKVFMVDRFGVAKEEFASNYGIVRPVIYLNSRVLYNDGDGTAEKPYTVR